MRADTTFSDRKLTREEFSKKYWMDGKVPYQYHTAEIEDGRDEREQFLINNCRALYELIRQQRKEAIQTMNRVSRQVEALERRVEQLEKHLQIMTATKATAPASQ